MKIVVLGATGKTGREVVRQALDAGHEVVAYVRHPEALESGGRLRVIRGSIDDARGMTTALSGADVLVSCLGPRDPLDFLRGTLMQRALGTVIAAMAASAVNRLVLMSAVGVGDTASITPTALEVPARTVMRKVYADKEKAEARLADSGLDARTVYPVILTDGPFTGEAQLLPITAGVWLGSLPRVSRSDVAALLLQLAGDDTTSEHRYVVAGESARQTPTAP